MLQIFITVHFKSNTAAFNLLHLPGLVELLLYTLGWSSLCNQNTPHVNLSGSSLCSTASSSAIITICAPFTQEPLFKFLLKNQHTDAVDPTKDTIHLWK